MKASDKFFASATPLFAIAIFGTGFILAVGEAYTSGYLAAGATLVIALICTGLFALGMQEWNNHECAAKSFMFNVSMVGVVIFLVGLIFFEIGQTYSLVLLGIGGGTFATPVFLASLYGLYKMVSNKIWVYRMTH